jgi:hypothetical protein
MHCVNSFFRGSQALSYTINSRFLWISKVHHRLHNSLPPIPFLSHFNPPQVFQPVSCMHFSFLSHMYMPRPPYSSSLIMKFFIIQFFSLLLLSFIKYRHSFPSHPQLCTSFTVKDQVSYPHKFRVQLATLYLSIITLPHTSWKHSTTHDKIIRKRCNFATSVS